MAVLNISCLLRKTLCHPPVPSNQPQTSEIILVPVMVTIITTLVATNTMASGSEKVASVEATPDNLQQLLETVIQP
jgi:hypothetical protein